MSANSSSSGVPKWVQRMAFMRASLAHFADRFWNPTLWQTSRMRPFAFKCRSDFAELEYSSKDLLSKSGARGDQMRDSSRIARTFIAAYCGRPLRSGGCAAARAARRSAAPAKPACASPLRSCAAPRPKPAAGRRSEAKPTLLGPIRRLGRLYGVAGRQESLLCHRQADHGGNQTAQPPAQSALHVRSTRPADKVTNEVSIKSAIRSSRAARRAPRSEPPHLRFTPKATAPGSRTRRKKPTWSMPCAKAILPW